MPAGTSAILSRLEGFPQDVAGLDLQLPDPASPAAAELVGALAELAERTPTPEARNTICQVAAALAPAAAAPLQDVLLLWAADPGPSVPAVTQLISAGLADGAFDGHRWLRAASMSESGRARDGPVEWGKEHFTDLLLQCPGLFIEPQLRVGILTVIQSVMLSYAYTPGEPLPATPMYQFVNSALFELVLYSLLLDTNNRLFALALSTLFTVLPFALQSLTPHVPLLMAILGRSLSWRDRPFVDAGPTALSAVTRTAPPSPAVNWSVANSMSSDFRAAQVEKQVVDLYLIGLYGAWPSNVIAFTRNAPEYLATKHVASVYAQPWSEVIEPGVIASRLIPLIPDFQLHPSILTFTSDGELQDEKRWDKNDPSEFVSMCYLMSGSKDDGMFEFFNMPTARLDPRAQEMERVPTETTGETDDVGRLREENELLRLESLYNRRLRKQLIYHIGRLHRNSLRFNIDEAEIHTFVNRIKEQTKSISTLTAELSQQRSEASQAQQKHVKWQKELRDKVSGFREERRNWQTEATTLRTDLQETQALVTQQREELAGVKNERFVLQARMLEATPMLAHLDDYKARNEQLINSQLLWDGDIAKLRQAERAVANLGARLHELETMVRARDKLCAEQADTIQHLESRAAAMTASSHPPTPHASARATPPQPADATFYVSMAENARKRAEKVERENLELMVEVERLRRASLANAETNSLM